MHLVGASFYTSDMDKEDIAELFDRERISKKLTLFSAQHLQEIIGEYAKRDTLDPKTAEREACIMTVLSLQEAVADVVVQNNRILWTAVQQLLPKESDSND